MNQRVLISFLSGIVMEAFVAFSLIAVLVNISKGFIKSLTRQERCALKRHLRLLVPDSLSFFQSFDH